MTRDPFMRAVSLLIGCSGLGLRLDVLRGVDFEDPVAPAMTVVNHRRPSRRLVDEQEEVVSDQLHLVQRLIDTHGLGHMQFATDDDWRVTHLDLHRLPRSQIRRDRRFGAGQGLLIRKLLGALRTTIIHTGSQGLHRNISTTVVLAPVPGAAKTQSEFIQRHIKGTELISARCLGPHNSAPRDDGYLHASRRVRLTGVALVSQHHLRALRIRRYGGHTIHLALDDITELLLDLRVASGNDDLHVDLLDNQAGTTRHLRSNGCLAIGTSIVATRDATLTANPRHAKRRWDDTRLRWDAVMIVPARPPDGRDPFGAEELPGSTEHDGG